MCISSLFLPSVRRHTGLDCDGSSDGCSSDLAARPGEAREEDQDRDDPDEPAQTRAQEDAGQVRDRGVGEVDRARVAEHPEQQDRKSTRLNSSHSQISYAVFCLKKKKHTNTAK